MSDLDEDKRSHSILQAAGQSSNSRDVYCALSDRHLHLHQLLRSNKCTEIQEATFKQELSLISDYLTVFGVNAEHLKELPKLVQRTTFFVKEEDR